MKIDRKKVEILEPVVDRWGRTITVTDSELEITKDDGSTVIVYVWTGNCEGLQLDKRHSAEDKNYQTFMLDGFNNLRPAHIPDPNEKAAEENSSIRKVGDKYVIESAYGKVTEADTLQECLALWNQQVKGEPQDERSRG